MQGIGEHIPLIKLNNFAAFVVCFPFHTISQSISNRLTFTTR